MKKIFLAALAVSTLFAACVKEGGDKDATQKLIISLPDNVTTRMVDEQVITGTSTVIGSVSVFMLNGNSVAAPVYEFTSQNITDKKAQIEQVPASVNRVIVVANIPAGDKSTVHGYTNAAAILGHTYTLQSQNANAGVAGQLMMDDSSSFTSLANPKGDGHDYKQVEVVLDALTARIEVGGVKAGKGIASIELLGVWVNNFYPTYKAATANLHASSSDYWKTTPLAEKYMALKPASVTIPTYEYSQYYDAGNATVTAASASSKVYGYQVFAGNIPHVILLVKGTYETGFHEAGKPDFLQWITFNKFDQSTTSTPDWIASMTANTIYKVGVGTTGITIDADMLTDLPEQTLFDLGVKVTVTPWTEKNVTPGI